MTSNLIAVGNASSLPATAELRPKASSTEGATRPVESRNPIQQTNTSFAATASPSAITAPEARTQESKVQETKAQETQVLDRQKLASMVDELNERFKGLRHTGLQFNIDDKVDQLVVKVMDVERDEVIRQIPPEELLELAAFLKERADKNAQEMEWAALAERGLAPKAASAPEGWLLNAEA